MGAFGGGNVATREVSRCGGWECAKMWAGREVWRAVRGRTRSSGVRVSYPNPLACISKQGFTMTKEEFKSLMAQAGFSKKNDLTKVLGISYNAINSWGNTKPFPKYIKPLLESLAQNRELQSQIKDLEKRIDELQS